MIRSESTGSAAIIIPARYASVRFPAKPLHLIRGADGQQKPLIQHSFEAALRVSTADNVYVATDDERIANVVREFGGKVIMTPNSCANGTERIAACLDAVPNADLLVNFQGDALLTPPHAVAAMVSWMQDHGDADAATVAVPCSPETYRHLVEDAAAGRVGGTTVVTDDAGRALYFSKRILPYLAPDAMPSAERPVLLHLGLYAYRRTALEAYVASGPCDLEQIEGLEQLRFLVRGVPMHVVKVAPPNWDMVEVNNPEDVPIVEAILTRRAQEEQIND
ncbi:3-deoxy-manno-octulosonate cytidylyltransferase [Sphingobium sp. CR28]|uniref:3-deoxy-manno-octulosonate cytidylyltransferase n=1 Tax=Sphingobium sp. CR28 TaxID=3400272 RepID=UPI003FEECF86